ncbi:MAG: serine hydrolase [Cyclobacteriaceae bacterium]|nr:serine hydrolase [Cyclobacteriaceae bacterium]
MKQNRNIVIYIAFFSFTIASCSLETDEMPSHGLEYSLPGREGLDEQLLLKMNDEIQSGGFGQINSMLVLKNKKLVFENYYNGYVRDDLQRIETATKNISSLVLGIAYDDLANNSVNDRLIDLLPGYSEYFYDVPVKDQITVHHLLTNRSGLWWNELNLDDGHPENDLTRMKQSSDWTKFVLAKPMLREPGIEFSYNSGNSILLASIVENYVGKPFREFAKERFFQPLGIDKYRWDNESGGKTNTGFGLSLRPVDLAKIGNMMLDSGRWQGKEIVSLTWIRNSTRSRFNVGYYRYGYQWWGFSNFNPISYNVTQNDIFFAWGTGGQFMFLVPHRDIVVVSTSNNYNDDIEFQMFRLFRDYILRAFPLY